MKYFLSILVIVIFGVIVYFIKKEEKEKTNTNENTASTPKPSQSKPGSNIFDLQFSDNFFVPGIVNGELDLNALANLFPKP